MTVVDLGALEHFLAEPRNAILIGHRSDGRPHSTPNWFLWEGGRFFVSTTRQRAKYRIFTDDTRVQVVVDDPTGFRYIVVDGTVEWIEDIDAGLDYFQRLRSKHGRTESSRDDLRAEMERDGRVTLVITPTLAPAQWHAMGL
jgi:PPOX class probable F420-dependent enzyme